MKKPYRFDEMSTQECVVPGCDKLIKLNLVDRKAARSVLKCRKHHWKNHATLSNRANR